VWKNWIENLGKKFQKEKLDLHSLKNCLSRSRYEIEGKNKIVDGSKLKLKYTNINLKIVVASDLDLITFPNLNCKNWIQKKSNASIS